MHSDLWRSLLQQHQESLKHQVGETRPDGDVVQQTLNVIHHHTAELRLISIIKDLKPKEEETSEEMKEETKERQRQGGCRKALMDRKNKGSQWWKGRFNCSISHCLNANVLLFVDVQRVKTHCSTLPF